MEILSINLSPNEAEKIYRALEIYHAITDTLTLDDGDNPFPIDDPTSVKVTQLLGWTQKQSNQISDQALDELSDYDEAQFKDGLL